MIALKSDLQHLFRVGDRTELELVSAWTES